MAILAIYDSKSKIKSRQRGLTLVEIMMVLGVMAFLLGLVMTIMQAVTTTQASNYNIELAITIKDVYQQLHESTGYGTGIDYNAGQEIANSGLMPGRFTDKNHQQLLGYQGGAVTVIGNGWGGYVAIRFYNIPYSVCVRMATSTWGQDDGMHDINVNMFGNGVYGVAELSPYQAVHACQVGSSNWMIINYYD